MTTPETVPETVPTSLEEAIPYAFRKVLEQGRRCGLEDHTGFICLYSDGRGGRCAIGWMLPDPPNSQVSVRCLDDEQLAPWMREAPSEVMELLAALQNAHDMTSEKGPLWRGSFIDRWNLMLRGHGYAHLIVEDPE